MRPVPPTRLPDEQRRAQRKARRLEWWTLAYLTSAIVLLYLVLGSSQAMRAAWLEDMLSLIPPIAFLVSSRVEERMPSERFPYGFGRAAAIGHLTAGLALAAMGGYLLFDSVRSLLMLEHPTIGTMVLFGQPIWQGWLMLPVLAWSGAPAVVLGRMKLPLARKLDDKVLHADADMNKADWTTAGAAMLGVIGVGLGLWWADAAAAGLISLDILHDGVRNTGGAVSDLMDRRPVTVDRSGEEPLVGRIRKRLQALPWVASADVRMRKEGRRLTGEAYLVPHDPDAPGLLDAAAEAQRELHEMDWRVFELTVVLEPSERVVEVSDEERGRR